MSRWLALLLITATGPATGQDAAVRTDSLLRAAGEAEAAGKADRALQLYDEALRADSLMYWAYPSRRGLLKAAAGAGALPTEAIVIDLRAIEQHPFSPEQSQVLEAGYRSLWTDSGVETYRTRLVEVLEDRLARRPDDAWTRRSLARESADPSTATRLFVTAAKGLGWRGRLLGCYREMFRIQTRDSVEIVPSDLFDRWQADIDSARTVLVGLREHGAKAEQMGQLLETIERAATERRLWLGEWSWLIGNESGAAEVLHAVSDSLAASGFHTNHTRLYVLSRLHLRLGEIALGRGDTAAAERRFDAAWSLLAPHEPTWSSDRARRFADLRELESLGTRARRHRKARR
jgi:hypothetical protein